MKLNLTEVKGELDNLIIKVGNVDTILPIMDRTRQKINKEIEDLNNTTNQLHLIDIDRTCHPTVAQFIFFSSTHETFSRREQMLGHETSLNKLKKNEITQNMLTNDNGMKLENQLKKQILGFQKDVEIKQNTYK